jgi:hypothetical protein
MSQPVCRRSLATPAYARDRSGAEGIAIHPALNANQRTTRSARAVALRAPRWQVAFRRCYFTGRAALHRSLQRFMVFYNYNARITATGSEATRLPPRLRRPGARSLNS